VNERGFDSPAVDEGLGRRNRENTRYRTKMDRSVSMYPRQGFRSLSAWMDGENDPDYRD